MNHQTKYWELLADGRVQCNVCPRECKLNEGQRGLCFVRACVDKKITLTLILLCLIVSCGKKGDPEYKDSKQKAEKIIILKNKA